MEKLLQNILTFEQMNYRINNEILWSNIFNNAIKGCPWLENISFCPGRWALGYPPLYVIFRILNDIQPKSILELGLGQSTKMIGSYVKYYENTFNDICHYVTEHDESWINAFNKTFELSEKTTIQKLDIKNDIINWDNENVNITYYDGFSNAFKDKKFDFICIDAPYGFTSPKIARIDVLSIIPQCLNDDFAILIDDCERQGEKTMAEQLKLILKNLGIDFCEGTYMGQKDSILIASASNRFLTTL